MARQKSSANRKTRPGRLRIVAGKWRSRLLPVAEHEGLRPTSERIRETLFNWLSGEIAGSRCLDLFAGSGSLGFEALSRGAGTVTMLDKSPDVVSVLRSSAAQLEAANAQIECADALSYLKTENHEPYDIVFLDPPFSDGLLEQSCQLLQSNGWLSERAAVYIEHERRQPLPQLPESWQTAKQKQAGNVSYLLVRLTA